MISKFIPLALFSTFVLSSFVFSISGQNVMNEVYEQGRLHKSQTSRIDMLITDKKGRKKERSFTNKTKILKKTTKSLIKIFQPTRLKGTAILTETDDNGSGDSKQWSYLPSFKAVRALNSHNKSQSFMGSDLTNDDVGGRHPSRDDHTLTKQDDEYYFVNSVPEDPKDLYSKIISKVHIQTKIPVEVQFYTQGELLKTLTVAKIGKNGPMYYSKESLVMNSKSGGNTKLKVTNMDTKTKIRTGEVSLQGLKQ